VIFEKSFFKHPTKVKTVSNVISRLKMTFKHILEHEFEGKNEFPKMEENTGRHATVSCQRHISSVFAVYTACMVSLESPDSLLHFCYMI